MGQQKIFWFSFLFDQSLYINKKIIMISTWLPNKNTILKWFFFFEIWIEICFYCFSLISFRLVVTAWKPDLMVCTEVLDWHNIHCKKNNRPSLAKMVSGDLQVWQVTYSLMYRRNTASICFCWNLPFITNWLDPSRLPKKIEFKNHFSGKKSIFKKIH